MGLDTTHDAWHGSYSGFNAFRTALAAAAGIDLGKMAGYYEEGRGIPWDTLLDEPLVILLDHADCEGDIRPDDCLRLADRLEALLPSIPADPGWIRAAATQFAAGCRAAGAAGETLEFH